MRQDHTYPHQHHAMNIVRPQCWAVFCAISIWLMATLAAMLIWPDSAALWAVMMVGGCGAIGMGYKSWKVGHPGE